MSAGFMLKSVKEKENFNRAQVAESSVATTADCKHHCHVPLENGDGVVINDQLAGLLSDVTLETAVSGIIFKHVGLKKERNMTSLGFLVMFRTTVTLFYVKILFLEQILY